MIKGFKYQLNPNNAQIDFFNKSFGCCRFVYNWALNKNNESYQVHNTKLSAYDLINNLKELKTDNPWLKEVDSQSLQQSIRNMESAFTRFFREKKGFPKFKSKHSKQSCKFTQAVKIDFDNKKIRLPKIGWINCHIDKNFDGDFGTVTVSKNTLGKYFISFIIDDSKVKPDKFKIKLETSVGIDVGLKHFAVLSTGNKIDNPKYLEKTSTKLAVHQRRLSKKFKGSNRYNNQKLKIAKIHYDITNQRKDFIHKLSSKLISENQTIIIEDLNISGMIKNHKLAKSISSASWSEFFRQLEYKSLWNGNNLIKIGRFEPSSKMCSCGIVNNNLTLKDRIWSCSACNTIHDRDILAANNIKRFGLQKQNLIGQTGVGYPEGDVESLALVGAMKRQSV